MTPEHTVAQLASWFEHRFEKLSSLAETLTSTVHLGADGTLVLSTTAQRAMKAAATEFLQQHSVVDGCGIIFAPSSLGTKSGGLEWWVREDESRFARYSFGVVPRGDRYYNYEQHEWFIRAFEEGRSAAVGPFIDYLGVEVYIMTLTVPAVVEGQRVGAVGTDLQIDDLERALLPMLQECNSDLAILSRHGNVLVSNTAQFLPGELVSDPLPGYRFVSLPEVTDGIRVMVAD